MRSRSREFQISTNEAANSLAFLARKELWKPRVSMLRIVGSNLSLIRGLGTKSSFITQLRFFQVQDILLPTMFRSAHALGSDKKHLSLSCFESPLSGIRSGPRNFLFHLVFFPAASFLAGEEFSVVSVVACITAFERGIVNFLPYPSLARQDW